MRDLRDILYKVALEEVVGTTALMVPSIHLDSRLVRKGDLFCALVGTASDGHDYIQKAIELGAGVIVCMTLPAEIKESVSYVKVKDTNDALAVIADNFYDNPSRDLKLIGVTGTNGKTTTCTLLFDLFTSLGYPCGLISTVEYRIGTAVLPSTHTTPDAIRLNALLKQMVDEGCEYAFMEVSSHAIHQKRTKSIHFRGGVFTNISHDHLDYHDTFKEYIQVKKAFFDDLPKTAFALSNIDDKRGEVMLQNTKAKKKTYALKSMADFKVRILENAFTGLLLNINGKDVHTRLIGDFNAYNLLAAYSTANLMGIDEDETLRALSALQAAEGRFDFMISPKESVIAIVDYCHTPDALLKVLETIKELRTGNEKVITVVGCGGDRDTEKRPVMAKIACTLSDKVILTSDNPRFEDPASIIADMQVGVGAQFKRKVVTQINRQEAIHLACFMAEANDIILVAGKGHEKYQTIKGEKLPFDDKQTLLDTFQNLEK